MFFACCASGGNTDQAGDVDVGGIVATSDEPLKTKLEEAGDGRTAAQKAADAERAKVKAKADALAKQMKEGEIAFGKQDWSGAIDAFTKAIEMEPRSGSAFAGRGGALLRKGDCEGSLKDLNQALEHEKENLFALRDRAEARLKTGDIDGAAEDFNAKLTLAPGDGRALCGRGEVKLKKGDKDGALSDFQLAMRLNYPGAQALYNSAKGGK